jgi:protoporphyrinogen/coproporphyrinogen III oxidase
VIIIVGGGLTGLACAYQLNALNVPHLVVEAADRPGGVIRSSRDGGRLFEWGPQRTRLTEGFRELVRDLGIESELITAPPDLPLYVYRDGRLRVVPFRVADYLRTDLLSWAGKLRLLGEPFSRGPRDEESVADFLTRKLGREAYEHLVGPLYGGLYGSDPAEMQVGLSLAHVLRELGVERSLLLPLIRRRGRIEPPPACSFHEGMQTLPQALLDRNPGNVRLGSTAIRVTPAPGNRYSVELPGETLEADHVVITVDATRAAELIEVAAPRAAVSLRRLNYNPLAVVQLQAATDLVGLGYQLSFAERAATRGVTFNHSLFGRTGIYTAFLGGARAQEVSRWSDERVMTTAQDEFRLVTGFAAEALALRHVRMPAWDRSWEALSGLALPQGLHLAANWESRPGIPGRLLQAKRLAVRLAGEDRERR